MCLSVSGPCPFAGIIVILDVKSVLLNSHPFKYLGTFCDDSSFALPIKQNIKLGDRSLVLIKYSINDFSQMYFTMHREARDVGNEPLLVVNSDSDYPYYDEYQDPDRYTCQAEVHGQLGEFYYPCNKVVGLVLAPGQHLQILSFYDYRQLSFEYYIHVLFQPTYILIKHQANSAECHWTFSVQALDFDKLAIWPPTSELEIHFPDFTEFFISKRRKVIVKFAKYCMDSSVVIDFVPLEVMSAAQCPFTAEPELSEGKLYYSATLDSCRVITTSVPTTLKLALHYSSALWTKLYQDYGNEDYDWGEVVIIELIISDKKQSSHDMTITVSHHTTWGTVEQAYLTRYLNMDLPFRGSESVGVHINNYESVEVRYGVKLDLFVHTCNSDQDMLDGSSLICHEDKGIQYGEIKLIEICTMSQHMYLTHNLYHEKHETGKFYTRDQHIKHTIAYYGPNDVSPNEAAKICNDRNSSLLQINSLKHFLAFIRSRKNPEFDTYRPFYNKYIQYYQSVTWVVGVNKPGFKTTRKAVELNCRNIRNRRHLVYSDYIRARYGTRHMLVYPVLSENIFDMNEAVFCDPERSVDLVKDLSNSQYFCPIIYPGDFCLDTVFLFVECEAKLDVVFFACLQAVEKETSHHENHRLSNVSDAAERLRLSIIFSMSGINYVYSLKDKLFKLVDDMENGIWTSNGGIFLCKDLTFILEYHICDGKTDCVDKDDEHTCTDVCVFHGASPIQSDQHYCFTQRCSKSNFTCMPLYFQCTSGGCIRSSVICDGYADCPDKSDELITLCSHTIIVDEEVSLTPSVQDTRPLPNYDVCITYEFEMKTRITLPMCQSLAGQCLFDRGRADCKTLVVISSLRCPRDKVFLPMKYVRPGVSFCRSSLDDVMMFKYATQPKRGLCQRVGRSVTCNKGYDAEAFKLLTTSLYINELHQSCEQDFFFKTMNLLLSIVMTNSNISCICSHMFNGMRSLTHLRLSNCSIYHLYSFSFLGLCNLTYLSLTRNPIEVIDNTTFALIPQLLYLDLSNTKISSVEEYSFQHLENLQLLDLSYTHMTQITPAMFYGLRNLTTLNISHIPVSLRWSFPDLSVFTMFPLLTNLYVTHAEICCMLDNTSVCIPDNTLEAVFGTCTGIIEGQILTVLLHSFVVLNIVTNMLSFVWQIVKSSGTTSIFQCLLNVADLVLGLYLCILIIIDYVYKGCAAFVAMIWKQTDGCRVIGALFMMSILLSNISTLVIGLDRFVYIVLHPFERKRSNNYKLLVVMVLGWFVGFLLPAFAGIFSDSDISNTACIMVGRSLSFHFAVVFVCINTALFLCMSISYTIIIYRLTPSLAHLGQRKQSILPVAIRLGCIILTDFLASLSVTAMVIVSGVDKNTSDHVETLLAFTVFPVISCVNPIINTLSTSKFLGDINVHIALDVVLDAARTLQKLVKAYIHIL